MSFEDKLTQALKQVHAILMERHENHGDSVFAPVKLFSTISPRERLMVMLDTKLSRYQHGARELSEENLNDLIGYLILLKIM
jgi:hypothetical protein|tara:strand:+ start:7559 stop:7804 length:246 start_codon:yes stop_codon:yes gene_type:complete